MLVNRQNSSSLTLSLLNQVNFQFQFSGLRGRSQIKEELVFSVKNFVFLLPLTLMHRLSPMTCYACFLFISDQSFLSLYTLCFFKSYSSVSELGYILASIWMTSMLFCYSSFSSFKAQKTWLNILKGAFIRLALPGRIHRITVQMTCLSETLLFIQNISPILIG